MLKFRA